MAQTSGQQIIKWLSLSRPSRWVKTMAPFAATYLFTSGRLDLNFWLGLIYFSFSFNLALRGLQQLKKLGKNSDQALTEPKLWLVLGLTNLPFIIYFLAYGTMPIKIATAVMATLLICNNIKNSWLQSKPYFKAAIISLLFTLPLVFGLSWPADPSQYLTLLLAMLSWCLASHIFASIAYLHSDRAHRHQSIAIKLGARRSASLSLWLYLASAGLIAINPTAASWLAAAFISLYALNVSFFKKYKSDAQSRNFERGWRNWQWLNLIVGFWLIMILLYAVDPLRLSSDKIAIVSSALIVISLFQTLLIAHNLIGFARVKAGRLREWPKVSVIIHAHNQADNIASTILALIGQNYPELEIIFTDLQSRDNTLKIVEGYADPRIKIVKIAPLRPGWTMHAHAAAELLRHASGELVVLLSADTVLKPNAIASFASIMEEKKLDLMSLLPADQNKTLAQKLILSQNQFFLLGIYPAAYLTKNLPKFASAYAGLMIFNRDKINSIDGFALVKNSPLEDLDLASRAKLNGLKTAFYLGSDIAVSQNHADLKLILEQTNRRFYPMLYFNMPLAVSLVTGGLFVFCAPIIMLGYQIIFHNAASINGLVIVLIIGLVNRLIVAFKTQQSTLGALLYPLTSLIAAVEIVASMLNYELLKPRWLERTEAH